jgi:hypothetical protein
MCEKPVSEKAVVQNIIRSNQILIDMGRGLRNGLKYMEMSLLFFVTAILLWFSLQLLTGEWGADPETLRVKEYLSAAGYLLPLVFAALSAASLITGLFIYLVALLMAGIEILYLRIKARRVTDREK